MHLPVKLNRGQLAAWLNLPHLSAVLAEDPRPLLHRNSQARNEFSRLVSAIYIGGTWKTTHARRHTGSNHLVVELIQNQPDFTILDVGISDGISCLELLDALGSCAARSGFRFYAADAYFYLPAVQRNEWVYFYNPLDHSAEMAISDSWIIFNSPKNAIPPLGWLARRLLAAAPPFPTNAEDEAGIDLLQPELRQRAKDDARIQLRKWDIFTPWPAADNAGSIDLVKVGNLLNRSYFSEARIYQALEHLHACLRTSGGLLLVENRRPTGREQWSYYERTVTGFRLARCSPNGGSDIEHLVAAWTQ